MDATSAGVVGGLAGMALGAVSVGAARLSERAQRAVPPQPPTLPAGAADVLAVLRSVGIVLDADDAVVKASPPAYAHGLVRGQELAHDELRDMARQVRRDGVIRETTLDLARGPVGPGQLTVTARVAPLGSSYILLLVDDETQARRVEEIRRDFVANVSHELKTPVGGIALLAEAVQNAKDDPEAVARFAKRMRKESKRLSRLVQEIIDLSRLQVADTLHEPELVDVAVVALEAVERSRLVAEDKQIEITTASSGRTEVYGDAELLITAMNNLVGNAVSYSAEDSRVEVVVRRTELDGSDLVEVSVSDEGPGIADVEQDRIFERFYRVDPARSRATGGTGLGLAIVKHVVENHGGEVTLWSEPGRGSTFTVRLPAAIVDMGEGAAIPAEALPPRTTAWSPDDTSGPAASVDAAVPPAVAPREAQDLGRPEGPRPSHQVGAR